MKMKCAIFTVATCLQAATGVAKADVIIGNDLNSTNGENPTINALYSGNRGSNGGGDQSLQFGDVLQGTSEADVMIGNLGIDVMFGAGGNDLMIGGPERGNPLNRDRAFGEEGDDLFIWQPGDGNDFFDGGPGTDVLMIARIDTAPVLDSGLPLVTVQNSGGFCEVLDQATEGVSELNLDHLVRFSSNSAADEFEEALAADPNIDPDTLDTGLRVAVHLINTEFVVCANRDIEENGLVDVFDLRQSPVQLVSPSELPEGALSNF